MTVVEREQGTTGRGRAWRHPRSALTAWLSRPLADFHLLLAIFGMLTAIGLIMVLSASAPGEVAAGRAAYSVFRNQLMYVGVGAVLFWITLRLPLRSIRHSSTMAMLVSVVLLGLVLTPLGTNIWGAQSWFRIGSISFQPIEPAKLAMALWGAHVLVTKRALLNQYRHLLVPVVPVALMVFALVMLQPDLGGTITLAVVLLSLLWFVGAPMRVFGAIVAAAVGGAVVLAVGASYRLDRVLAYLDPEEDPLGSGMQSLQAMYALAEGGFFGKGLTNGSAKWRYLPNVHSDFIFAVIGEELGFIGCLLVLGLFALLAVVGLRIAARNTDPWIRMIAGTLTVWLVAQAAINIGYVVRLLPVTGITLPMISSGGTSIVTTMIVFGILASCARHEPEAVAALRKLGPGRVGGFLRLPAPEAYRPPARRKPGRPSTPPRAPGRRAAAAPKVEERRVGGRSAPPSEYRRRESRRATQDRTTRTARPTRRTGRDGR
ncbi:putative lipid II flippase FtsW [Actinosynnema pretiosum subsp. pretiosum]|uniref:Probable peptidoglycan glycosyltransferase FtsW n=2 Tax=Actinosynnema TaxID=40566 RepID=C6WDE0_ACTMD|nr:putative lipid II flippase FtsW [Actinosynnema mirum]ACU39577.1 cell division protein FtsW [Actinosynnema mirum DSM 43827]QUF03066.1 putative lipid II flippase FtsW [Actinosynnema pretiosum subsp. pretiosum]